MTARITQAQPPLDFIPPNFNPVVFQLAKSVIPTWLRWRKQIDRIEVEHPERLIELYRQFQAGQTRFLLAFRHPAVTDPPCIAQFIWNQIPAIARQQGQPLQQPVHLHFVYDRGIPIWAGPAIGWLFTKLGGTPIKRGRLDTAGLRSIRELFANGQFPIAAAPEGGINGHNEIVSPLEPGIAQFGFWCVDDLQKAGRTEQVCILPLGLQYFFETPPWRAIADLLTELEMTTGLAALPESAVLETLQAGVVPTEPQEQILYQRLYRLGEHILQRMEQFYRDSYGQSLTQQSGADASIANDLGSRLPNLLNTALTVVEQTFGIRPKGPLPDRCRRVEQAAWDRIYLEPLKEPNAISDLDRGLADLIAEEADLRLWHMRLVETFTSVTGKYVAEKPTVERFADTTLLIWKVLAQINRQPANQPPDLGAKFARFTVSEPISTSERWSDYQASRRKAVAEVTQTLQAALEAMIQS